jgi:hypothetical protein
MERKAKCIHAEHCRGDEVTRAWGGRTSERGDDDKAGVAVPPIDELPDHLVARPKEYWQWPLPTSWLLGTKLIGALRDMLLSSVVKVDIRAWMTAGEVIDLSKATTTGDDGACYVDFLADTGDSQQMVYQLARLLTQPTLEVERWQGAEQKSVKLPRGALLVLGGDTAYPIATHRRLLERIRAPFQWAHDELAQGDKDALAHTPISLVAVPGNHDYYDGLRGFEALVHSPPVPIWRAPRAAEGTARPTPPASSQNEDPIPAEQPLRLPGYKLEQHASYFAIGLPFGWRLWGLDIENAEIDDRQAAYFRRVEGWKAPVHGQAAVTEPAPVASATLLQREPNPPDRLILVTSRPAFVYQGQSDHAEVIKRSMAKLGLEPAFASEGELDDTRARLDLSGDVHLYERYWGTDHQDMPDDVDRVHGVRQRQALPAGMSTYEPPERYRRPRSSSTQVDPRMRKRGNDEVAREEQGNRANYASVVSGLGGTFHHPSQVRMGDTAPHASWPSQEHSAREVGIRLVDPYQIFRAGAVGIAGLVISLLRWPLLDGQANVLDVPFQLGDLTAESYAALRQLGLVAGCVGIVLAMIGLPIGAYYLGRRWAQPIREMRMPTRWWPRLTRRLTHARATMKLLRFFGANPRSSWLFLTTFVSWAGTVGGWYWLADGFRTVATRVDANGPVLVSVVTTVLVVGMAALGLLRAGQRRPNEHLSWNVVRRIVFAGFGAFIALLVLWTPYIWIHLVCCSPLLGVLGLGVILLTMIVRLGDYVFRRQLWTRRVITLCWFAALLTGAVGLPWSVHDVHASFMPSSWPVHALAVALFAFLGAYFACLWTGWYFCICLQWNAHGNEAGGAARVTEYGAFLRIKLTRDQAEVWAIAVEPTLTSKPPLHRRILGRKTIDFTRPPTARLIDHFTLQAPRQAAVVRPAVVAMDGANAGRA